jgi:hypothetical protein
MPKDLGFDTARPFTDRSIYEEWKASGVERPFLDYFLRRTVTLTPSWEAEKVKEFLDRGTSATSSEASFIRLDDREHATNSSRIYTDTVSELQLHQHLSQPRFKAPSLPDAHRRLIAVRNLNPSAITTLAQTALFHQVDPLMDAFWKHITSETSLKVHEPLDGFVTPRLEFHMPYLTLRKESKVRFDGSEQWKDITFLNRALNAQGVTERQLVYVAHVSIILCIWDHKTWTGYNFSRPCPLLEPSEEDSDTDSDDGTEADIGDDEVPKEDIFAPDSGDHDMNDAPIWDPRMYFLHLLSIWTKSVVQEYTNLVRNLEGLVTVSPALLASAVGNVDSTETSKVRL